MQPFSLNIGGKIHRFDSPVVMAIVNVTTDSFYSDSRAFDNKEIAERTLRLIANGTDIIDIGAYSSRPGNNIARVTAEDEYAALARAMEAIRQISDDIIVSIDTFRADVAYKAITQLSANIINDISGLNDPGMLDVLAQTHSPYILMHMRGTPDTMQQHCDYPEGQVAATVMSELSVKLRELEAAGICDVIIDPGFGFSKTVDQNYELLRSMPALCGLGYPVLAGVSRKSMITQPLGITPDEALPATTALNLYAVSHGASILRVHDPAEACQAITLANYL